MNDIVENQPAVRPELYGSSTFVNCLDSLVRQMQLPENGRVLYPGSSTHTDIADYFGRYRVVHVDLHQDAMEQMTAGGYQARMGEIGSFEDEPYDLIVALNTAQVLGPDLVSRLLKSGGYVITNMDAIAKWLTEEGLLNSVAVVEAEEGASMGPHFQNNTLSLYKGTEE